MMPTRNLVRMVVGNLMRGKRSAAATDSTGKPRRRLPRWLRWVRIFNSHFLLSAFGIVVGIATFVVFLASTEQVGNVLEKIFPLDQVEVVAPRASFATKDITKKLDDAIVKMIRDRPEVASAVPRQRIAFPASGLGNFEGKPLNLELGGFADGVDPGFVQDDPRTKELFRDWLGEKNDPHRVACTPPASAITHELIESPRAPPKSRTPKVAVLPPVAPAPEPAPGAAPEPAPGAAPIAPVLTPPASPFPDAPRDTEPRPGELYVPSKNGEYYNPCPDPDRYYCDDETRTCEHRVPVVLSPTMIEIYNGQFAKAYELPIIETDFVKWALARGGLSAMRFSLGLGHTMVGGEESLLHAPRRVEAVLVGISQKSMQLGMTVPIQYVSRWNEQFRGKEAALTYSSIVVTMKDRSKIPVFAQWLRDKLDLRLEDSTGEKFATALFVIRLVLVLISLVIIGISAINIAHNFFMQVTERKRELGLLRAVGATQSDVRMVVLGEALLIGLIGGVLGVLLGMAIAAGIDYASAHLLPAFPYKPATWFNFKWWIWVGGLACASGFAVVGGYLPARRASMMEPAQALSQN